MRGRMPTLEIINERFARNLRIGLFNFIRRSPEISVGGIKVQKYSAFLREIVVPTNFNIVQRQAAARHGADRVRPEPGVRGDRHPVRRRRQVPHPHRGPRLLADRAARHPAPARGHLRRVQEGLEAASTRWSSSTSARRCSRSSPTSPRPARSWCRPPSRSRSATPAARCTSAFPYSTLEPIRDVLYSHACRATTGARPPLGAAADAPDPVGRGRAGGRAGARAGHRRAAAVLQGRATSSSSTSSR